MQVDELIENVSIEEQVATLSTFKKIFDNVIQHPNDDKYHQIKLTNKIFSNKVWQYPAGKTLMTISGWIVEDDHVRLQDASSVLIALAIISLKLKVSIALYNMCFGKLNYHIVHYAFL